MASPSPGEEAARVCLEILRGAAQLAQPYAAQLAKVLQEEGRKQDLEWVEALLGCLSKVVAAAHERAAASLTVDDTDGREVSTFWTAEFLCLGVGPLTASMTHTEPLRPQ
jgi:hypothetical protein